MRRWLSSEPLKIMDAALKKQLPSGVVQCTLWPVSCSAVGELSLWILYCGHHQAVCSEIPLIALRMLKEIARVISCIYCKSAISYIPSSLAIGMPLHLLKMHGFFFLPSPPNLDMSLQNLHCPQSFILQPVHCPHLLCLFAVGNKYSQQLKLCAGTRPR